MDVSVRHRGTGHSCVVGVPEGGNVVSLKVDALEEMFPGSINADRTAAGLAAHIEGCEEELDDAERVADTGLEDGGAVELLPRWPHVRSPAVYSPAHGKTVYCSKLSRCGKLCAVGYFSGHITVFDTITADAVADLTHGKSYIIYTAFSVCGAWLASVSADGTTCVWLTSTWEQVRMLDHDKVCCAAWTHCGRLVSGDKSNKVRVWDLKGTPSATVLEGHSAGVYCIAVSGTSIFSGSNDSTIRVWGISTLTHTHTLDEHTDAVADIAISNDERHLVSCSSDNSLKVWCTAALSCLRTVQLGSFAYSLAVTQPGDLIVLSTFAGTTLYRLSTGGCLGEADPACDGVVFSPCGRWVFTTTNHTSVSVCDVSSIFEHIYDA